MTVTACGGSSDGSPDDKPTAPPPVTRTSTAPRTDLKFGGSYTWPDGLKVSVTGAKVFTDYADGESHDPGSTDFRVVLRLTNGGTRPVDLGELSVIVQGATSGGEAASTVFKNGSAPLEGRLAPGATAVKTDDWSMETKYGRRVVVRVQRVADDFGLDFPEFTGEITG